MHKSFRYLLDFLINMYSTYKRNQFVGSLYPIEALRTGKNRVLPILEEKR